MAMRFAFDGGSAQDPDGKEGLANFITGMMDEGAGDLDAQTFQRRMEEIAMRMSFTDDKDHLYGSFETLTENRKAAVELLKLAINKPRFDADAVDRVREQLLSRSRLCRARSQQGRERAVVQDSPSPAIPTAAPPNGTAETAEGHQPAPISRPSARRRSRATRCASSSSATSPRPMPAR